MNDFTIGVPSGWGDISWMYSKLHALGPMDYEIADGEPRRSREFMELLPNVRSVNYGDFRYDEILAMEQALGIPVSPRWKDHCAGFTGSRLLLQGNRHLEMGRPLSEWMADLPTEYHYPIAGPKPFEQQVVDKLLNHLKRPLIGVSCASYRGSDAWKTWGYEEWAPFLTKVQQYTGGTIVLMGGYWDDLTHALKALDETDSIADIVGKTSAGACVQVLRELDYYIGFSSGLAVIRTVLRKNAFALWPDFQSALSTSWVPPEMLENRQYVAHPWRNPEIVWRTAMMWLRDNAC